jgi:hypothetical protein
MSELDEFYPYVEMSHVAQNPERFKGSFKGGECTTVHFTSRPDTASMSFDWSGITGAGLMVWLTWSAKLRMDGSAAGETQSLHGATA